MTGSLVQFRLPAYAPGPGWSRRPGRDDPLSLLISAPSPGGGRDDCGGGKGEDDRDELILSRNMVKYSGNREVQWCKNKLNPESALK